MRPAQILHARAGCIVDAEYGSTVEGYAFSVIYAHAGSEVIGWGDSTTVAFDGSSVHGYSRAVVIVLPNNDGRIGDVKSIKIRVQDDALLVLSARASLTIAGNISPRIYTLGFELPAAALGGRPSRKIEVIGPISVTMSNRTAAEGETVIAIRNAVVEALQGATVVVLPGSRVRYEDKLGTNVYILSFKAEVEPK